MKTIIDTKLKELLILAAKDDDKPLLVIINAVMATRVFKQDAQLAMQVGKYVQDVLLPDAIRIRDIYNTTNN